MIAIRYEACDGFRQRRTFKTLIGARRYSHERIGETPELGRTYAASGDGVGTIRVDGATLLDIFPLLAPKPEREPRPYLSYEQMQGDTGNDYDERDERSIGYEAIGKQYPIELDKNGMPFVRPKGCTCSQDQIELVGCDCDASRTDPEWMPW